MVASMTILRKGVRLVGQDLEEVKSPACLLGKANVRSQRHSPEAKLLLTENNKTNSV